MNIGFQNADILLPGKAVDPAKWAVVACDQYTSEPGYWAEVEKIVGEAPSTYRMILPEVYLEQPDVEERLNGISGYMDRYLEQGVFEEYKDAMVYVERTDSSGKVRAGIIGAIDLEEYDYHKGSGSLVRATEATVISRIPPRIKVRQNAKVELPHIMILIDDRSRSVIEPLAGKNLPTLYDFDLMQGGGHLKGALIDPDTQGEILSALADLGKQENFNVQYGITDRPVLLFAMGDGNHSLATAKEFYEQLKAANPGEDFSHHPARYALVEIVNLHSPALEFEAIHRILTGIDPADLMKELTEELGLVKDEKADLEKTSPANSAPVNGEEFQQFVVVEKGVKTAYTITRPCSKLTVGSLQNVLDRYLQEKGGSIDYIHGADVLLNLTMQPDSIGFLLPDMGKDELFLTVIEDGALPRKTFSMGHAQDKRFYMECRRIVK